MSDIFLAFLALITIFAYGIIAVVVWKMGREIARKTCERVHDDSDHLYRCRWSDREMYTDHDTGWRTFGILWLLLLPIVLIFGPIICVGWSIGWSAKHGIKLPIVIGTYIAGFLNDSFVTGKEDNA